MLFSLKSFSLFFFKKNSCFTARLEGLVGKPLMENAQKKSPIRKISHEGKYPNKKSPQRRSPNKKNPMTKNEQLCWDSTLRHKNWKVKFFIMGDFMNRGFSVRGIFVGGIFHWGLILHERFWKGDFSNGGFFWEIFHWGFSNQTNLTCTEINLRFECLQNLSSASNFSGKFSFPHWASSTFLQSCCSTRLEKLFRKALKQSYKRRGNQFRRFLPSPTLALDPRFVTLMALVLKCESIIKYWTRKIDGSSQFVTGAHARWNSIYGEAVERFRWRVLTFLSVISGGREFRARITSGIWKLMNPICPIERRRKTFQFHRTLRIIGGDIGAKGHARTFSCCRGDKKTKMKFSINLRSEKFSTIRRERATHQETINILIYAAAAAAFAAEC